MNKVPVHKHIIIRAEVLDPLIKLKVLNSRRMILAIGMKVRMAVASYSKCPVTKD